MSVHINNILCERSDASHKYMNVLTMEVLRITDYALA